MTLSTTFQSRILRTKKRLSEDPWTLPVMVISILTLLTGLSFAMRAVSVPMSYAAIRGHIPVVSAPIDDPGFHTYKEAPIDEVRAVTPMVVMTWDGFFFGPVESFTKEFDRSTNKYIIPNKDNQHQTAELMHTMARWIHDRKESGKQTQKHVILLPHGDMPMSVVLPVMGWLEQSDQFDRVILGSGLM